MPVVWRDELSVGNDVIDHDHKYLLCLFNSIELALANGESVQHLPLFFEQLLDYTREHFHREEQLQIKIQYPGYVEHKISHQQIVESLEQTYGRLNAILGQKGDDPMEETALAQLKSEVLDLAREWVIDHLVKTDRKLGTHLKRLPADFK